MFTKHFKFQAPSALVKEYYELKKDKKKNSDLVKKIKSGLEDLKEEIKSMSKEEKEIEKTNKAVDIVENILEFTEEIQKQQGLGLKILTPNQMLSRLPISLTQLKEKNNS